MYIQNIIEGYFCWWRFKDENSPPPSCFFILRLTISINKTRMLSNLIYKVRWTYKWSHGGTHLLSRRGFLQFFRSFIINNIDKGLSDFDFSMKPYIHDSWFLFKRNIYVFFTPRRTLSLFLFFRRPILTARLTKMKQ